MKKLKYKPIFKNVIFLMGIFVFIFTLLVSKGLVYAGEQEGTGYDDEDTTGTQNNNTGPDPEICKVEEFDFTKCLKKGANISGTTCDFVSAIIQNQYDKIVGVSLNETMGCSDYIGARSSVISNPMCGETPDEVCDSLLNSLAPGETAQNSGSIYAYNYVSGSLLGVVYNVENASRYEPIPVNLAYYWNENVTKIPFVGRAMAANPISADNVLIESIFEAWGALRNLAYALMAIAMLVTGIMIVLRKKINSQVVVTLQYSLPKIVIALFLITFSYPIGAALTTFGWTLFRSGPQLAQSILFVSPADFTPDTSMFALTLITIIILLLTTGAGTIVFTIIIGVVLVCLVMYLFYLFKAFTIYLKMIFSIVTAPLEFSLGALPGNEVRFSDWFKRMAKYTLTLFAMGLIVSLVFNMGLSLIDSVGSEVAGLGGLMYVVMPALTVLYGLGLAIGMDKRMDALFGEKKKY